MKLIPALRNALEVLVVRALVCKQQYRRLTRRAEVTRRTLDLPLTSRSSYTVLCNVRTFDYFEHEKRASATNQSYLFLLIDNSHDSDTEVRIKQDFTSSRFFRKLRLGTRFTLVAAELYPCVTNSIDL
jgi:hypothetical protein